MAVTIMQTLKAYDDAFRIVQDAVMRQHSLIGMNLLTRVEFYLLNQSRQQIGLITSDPSRLPDPPENEKFRSTRHAEPSSVELGTY